MTSLAEQQLTIRELIKGRFADTPDDPYLTRVAGSAGLAMIREIAIWWRAQNIEAGCIWTSLLLKRRGIFEQRVEVFFHRSLGSAFIEDTVEDFLSDFTHDADSLTAAVAAFELAVLKAKGGDDREFRITWDRPQNECSRILHREALCRQRTLASDLKLTCAAEFLDSFAANPFGDAWSARNGRSVELK